MFSVWGGEFCALRASCFRSLTSEPARAAHDITLTFNSVCLLSLVAFLVYSKASEVQPSGTPITPQHRLTATTALPTQGQEHRWMPGSPPGTQHPVHSEASCNSALDFSHAHSVEQWFRTLPSCGSWSTITGSIDQLGSCWLYVCRSVTQTANPMVMGWGMVVLWLTSCTIGLAAVFCCDSRVCSRYAMTPDVHAESYIEWSYFLFAVAVVSCVTCHHVT